MLQGYKPAVTEVLAVWEPAGSGLERLPTINPPAKIVRQPQLALIVGCTPTDRQHLPVIAFEPGLVIKTGAFLRPCQDEGSFNGVDHEW